MYASSFSDLYFQEHRFQNIKSLTPFAKEAATLNRFF